MALTEAPGQTLREKMVYMSVGDSHHNQGNHGERSHLQQLAEYKLLSLVTSDLTSLAHV